MRKFTKVIAIVFLIATFLVPAAALAEEPTETEKLEARVMVLEAKIDEILAFLILTVPAESTAMSEAEPQLAGDGAVNSWSWSIDGVPDRVDANVVDTAKGDFVNTLGLGTEGWLAEPGKLLVGPDFDQALIDASGGAIERFNPLNQDACRNEPPCTMMVPGGGFAFASLGWGQMEVDGVFGHASVNLPGREGHNWHVYIRGRYGDGRVDTDENLDAILTDYTPGHVDIHYYPGQPNGGFVSEGQFLQKANTSHTGGTNCGDAGCSSLSALFLDLNTGAWTLITRGNPADAWRLVSTNWSQ